MSNVQERVTELTLKDLEVLLGNDLFQQFLRLLPHAKAAESMKGTSELEKRPGILVKMLIERAMTDYEAQVRAQDSDLFRAAASLLRFLSPGEETRETKASPSESVGSREAPTA